MRLHDLPPKAIAAAGRLKRVDRDHAGWTGAAYRSGPLLHEDGARLDWRADARWTCHASLRLMAGAERLTLQLESLPALASFLTGPFDDWPQEEWCTLVEIAAAPLLDLLARALRKPLNVAHVHMGLVFAPAEPAGPAPSFPLCFHYRRADGAPRVRGRLLCNDPVALELAPGPASGPDAWAPWEALPVPLRLGAGHTWMTPAELAGIRIGDVLRSSLPLPAAPLQFGLLLGARTLALVRADIDSSFRHHLEITSMPTTSPDSAGIGEIGNIGDIAVDVRYEIGSQSVTLKELTSVRPGVVLPLGFDPLQECVTIRANGLTVGRGELVVVEEELAVRVTEWTAAGHA